MELSMEAISAQDVFDSVKVRECVGITIPLIFKKVRVCGPCQKNLLIGGLASILCLQEEGIVNFVSIKVHYLGEMMHFFQYLFGRDFHQLHCQKHPGTIKEVRLL